MAKMIYQIGDIEHQRPILYRQEAFRRAVRLLVFTVQGCRISDQRVQLVAPQAFGQGADETTQLPLCLGVVTSPKENLGKVSSGGHGPAHPLCKMGAMERGFEFIAHGGKYVLVSIVPDRISFADPEFHKREATLLASRNATPEDFETVLDAMRRGEVPTDALNTLPQSALIDAIVLGVRREVDEPTPL